MAQRAVLIYDLAVDPHVLIPNVHESHKSPRSLKINMGIGALD